MKRNPSDKNIASLRQLLDDGNSDVRATALNAIVTLQVPDAGELAVAGLRDEDAFVRATAAKLVGDQEDPALSGFLIERIRTDPDPLVRRRAVRALSEVGGNDSGAAMIEALRDPDPQVRLAAIRGARKLAPGEGADRLATLLANDPMWEVRVQAANALGLSGAPIAGEALKNALEDPIEFVRSAAIKALTEYRPAPPAAEPTAQPDAAAPGALH